MSKDTVALIEMFECRIDELGEQIETLRDDLAEAVGFVDDVARIDVLLLRCESRRAEAMQLRDLLKSTLR